MNKNNVQSNIQPSVLLDGYEFHVSSQLMYNYNTGVVFEPTGQRAISRNVNGDYLFFVSGKDSAGIEQIYLFQENQGGNTPLGRISLTDDIASTYTFLDIQTAQDSSQNTYLGILATSKTDNNQYLIHTNMFDKDVQNRWSIMKLDAPLIKWGFGFTGTDDLIFTMTDEKKNIFFADTNNTKQQVQLPVDCNDILDVAVVNINTLSGTGDLFAYLLIKDSDDEPNLFIVGYKKGDTISNFNHMIAFNDSTNYNPSTIGNMHVSNKDSLLFVGANGSDNSGQFSGCKYYQITLSKSSASSHYTDAFVPIFTSNAEISKSIMGQTTLNGKTILEGWFLGAYSADTSKPWLLRMLYDQSNPGVTTPLPLMQVENHYLVRNPRDNSIDMFVMEQGENAGTVSHLWIDNETSLWKKQSVQIEDNTQTNKLTTNSTYIRINNISSNGSTFPNLQISATQEVSVTINGKNYQLKPSTYTNVMSNAVSGLSIINNTQSIDTPIYLISFENSQNAVRIRTVASTQQNMNNLDFSQVPGVSKDDANNYKQFSAGAINTAQDLDSTGDISLVPKNSASSRQLQKSLSGGKKLPDNFFLALSFHEDKPRCFTKREDWLAYVNSGSLAIKPKQLEGFFSDIWDDVTKAVSKDIHAIGDLIKSAENFLDSVGNFVIQKVEDGYHFTIHLAETVIDMIVDTVEHAWAAISTFVKKVFKDIEEVIKYMGYLFNWDDIKTVHSAIKNFTNISIKQLITDLANPQSGVHLFINNTFNNLENKLRKFKYPSFDNPSSDEINTNNQYSNTITNTPESGMMGDILQRNVFSASSLSMVSKGKFGDSENVFPVGDDILKQFIGIIKDIVSLNQNSLIKNFEDIANRLINVFIDMLEIINSGVNSILEQLGGVLQLIADTLNTPIEIPVLSFIYKEMSGNSLTAIDAFSLVLAIPITVGTKLSCTSLNIPFDITVFQKLIEAKDFQTLLQRIGITSNTGLFPDPTSNIIVKQNNDPSFSSTSFTTFDAFIMSGSVIGKSVAFCFTLISAKGPSNWGALLNLVFLALEGYSLYTILNSDSTSSQAKSKGRAIAKGTMPFYYISIYASYTGAESPGKRYGLAVSSVLMGLLPTVLALDGETKYDTHDWLDFIRKISDGVASGSGYLVAEKELEGSPAIVGVITLVVSSILYILCDVEEGPERFFN